MDCAVGAPIVSVENTKNTLNARIVKVPEPEIFALPGMACCS
jgi:hypothetical protein